MGCGGSKKNEFRRSSPADQHHINIQIGDEVKIPNGRPVLIFVFGGPGSKKGRLVGELVETYGFNFINVEKMLLRNLAEKASKYSPLPDAAQEVQNTFMNDTQIMSLGWILEEVSKLLEVNGGKTCNFVVDIMPNLRFLIKADIFLADCSEEMNKFEDKHPIAFAINFVQRPSKPSKKETDLSKDKEEKGPMRSDEADSSRTRRRLTLFENNVKPLIDFFHHSGRLVTLDVTGARMDLVWSRLCELFTSLHLSSQVLVNYTVIFLFDHIGELQQLITENYNVQVISLQSLLDNPSCTLEEAMAALSKRLEQSDPTTKTFVASLLGTNIAEDSVCQSQDHSIMFVDEEVTQLDKFLDVCKAKGGTCPVKFKAVCTTGNTMCLFPSHVSLTLCKEMAMVLSQYSQH